VNEDSKVLKTFFQQGAESENKKDPGGSPSQKKSAGRPDQRFDDEVGDSLGKTTKHQLLSLIWQKEHEGIARRRPRYFSIGYYRTRGFLKT